MTERHQVHQRNSLPSYKSANKSIAASFGSTQNGCSHGCNNIWDWRFVTSF